MEIYRGLALASEQWLQTPHAEHTEADESRQQSLTVSSSRDTASPDVAFISAADERAVGLLALAAAIGVVEEMVTGGNTVTMPDSNQARY